MFNNVWGHDLTDNIRRIWFLRSDAFKHEFKDCPLVYIPTNRGVFFKKDYNFHRLLEILEVDVNKLQPIEQPMQFDKIILPNESFHVGVRLQYTIEYRETLDRVRDFALKNQTPTASKKVYYYHGARQLGEERLAEYFKSNGYAVVSPENLTLDEQLNLLINAESFASTLGSCAHNSIFLRDDTETIFIPRTVKRFTPHQLIIDQVHPLHTNYVDSTFSIFSPSASTGNYCYVISPQLKRFFGDKWNGYEEEDFKIFLQYLKRNLGHDVQFVPGTKEYYGSIFEDFMTQLKRREDLIAACNMPPRWETFQPSLNYQTHVDKKGWSTRIYENHLSNPLEDKLDIQAVKINFPKHKIFYSVYYNAEEGWATEVSNGEQAGTTGKRKSIYGIRIRLDEAGDKEFDVLYRVHTFDGAWTAWAKNGEVIYSHGVKLNALQIKLEPKANA